MKTMKLLILWILVLLIIYLGFATVIVWPLMLDRAELIGADVSPIALLFQAWETAWMFIFTILAPYLVIPVVFWLYGFYWLLRRYQEE